MGLFSVGEETYLQGISDFRLFTRVRNMSENMEEPKNNIISVSRRRHYGWCRRKILDFSISRNLKNEI